MTMLDDHDHDILAARYDPGTARIIDALDAIYGRTTAPRTLHVEMRHAIRTETLRPRQVKSLSFCKMLSLDRAVFRPRSRRWLLLSGLVVVVVSIASSPPCRGSAGSWSTVLPSP